MKVVMPEREYINWGEIQVGECFIFNGELYMKINEVDKFNSVCLNDGKLECFSNEDYLEFAVANVIVE